jgi:hypothetical protein
MLYKFILVIAAFILCSCVEISKDPSPQYIPNILEREQQSDTWGRGTDPWISDWERAQKKQAHMNQNISRATAPKNS